MTYSTTGSAVQNGESFIEVFRLSAGLLPRNYTPSQVWAFSSTTVPIKTHVWIWRTGLAPTSTRIFRMKPGVPTSSLLRRTLFSRTPSLSQLTSCSFIPTIALTVSAEPAQRAS